jgi:hypothetical protein
METNETVIHEYTRRQAVADGVLIDAGEMAREAGFKWPVALTAAAWDRCVRVPLGAVWQDEAGRLWDVLQVLRVNARRATGAVDALRFTVSVVGTGGIAGPVTLKAVIGPDDDGRPCLTVMLPDED